jgi:hypothetical protein
LPHLARTRSFAEQKRAQTHIFFSLAAQSPVFVVASLELFDVSADFGAFHKLGFLGIARR